MLTYEFGLSGSWWVLILAGIVALGLSAYTYRITVPPISARRKTALIALRTLALTLLLFIVLEPVLNIIEATEEPPRLAVLLDNSQSTAMQDAGVNRREQYRSALQNMDPEAFSEHSRVLRFDNKPEDIADFSADSLALEGQLSNISGAFATLLAGAEHDNVRAVLLMTDGAFNAGENPIYNAELLGRPVYVVGIGDSTEPRDVSVQSVITNSIAYVGSPAPVNVNVKVAGFEEGSVKVSLLDNGQAISEQTIVVRPGVNTYTLVYEYKPQVEGSHKLELRASALEGELTDRNNVAAEFVKVLKTKRRILLFAGAPSADVSFIRSVLGRNNNIEVKTHIQKKGGEFLEGLPTPAALAEAELIVMVGFPIASTPPALVQQIAAAAEQGKPLFFMADRDTDYSRLRPLEPYLPFNTASSQAQEMLVFADVPEQAAAHPVLKIEGAREYARYWNTLPPLYRTETFVRAKPEAQVLATIRINNAPLNEPLIILRTLQNKKSLAVLGYGLYRWKLMGYAAEQAKGRDESPDVYSAFIENSVRWLTTRDQGRLVRIKTSENVYANGEKVEFIGQVYDATYNPVDDADVRVRISGGEEARTIVLAPLGAGRYRATVEGLGEGEYAYNGSAQINNQPYGSDAGRFSVGQLNIEFQNPRMNAALLRTIAERTGGRFYIADNVAGIMDDIRRDADFKARPVTVRSELALWNLPWMLAFAIVLFGLEWFLRKRGGMI